MHTVMFSGTITTTSPFTCSPIGSRGAKDEALLPRIPVVRDGLTLKLPVIPAAGQRGVWRRCATDCIVDIARGNGATISVEDYLLWASGGVKGSTATTGTRAEDPLFRRALVERSPLLALFGAGHSPAGFVASGLSVSPAVPLSPVDPVMVDGARRHELKSERFADYAVSGVLPADELRRADALTNATARQSTLQADLKKLKQEIRKAEADRKDELKAEIEKINADLAAAKSEMQEAGGSDNALGRPLPGYEVIPIGVEMSSILRLRTPNTAALGLLLAALARFADEPHFGAHVATGCGFVRCDWRVSEAGKEIGRVTVDEGAFGLEGEKLERALAEWKVGIDLRFLRANLDADTEKKLAS